MQTLRLEHDEITEQYIKAIDEYKAIFENDYEIAKDEPKSNTDSDTQTPQPGCINCTYPQEVEETMEVKPMQKGIPFGTFDTVRYVFLRQKQFRKYCLDIVVKNTTDDKFRIIVPDYPYKSSYNKNKTYVINLHTNKIYMAVTDGDDEYNNLTGMAVAFAKATNKRIPILVKQDLKNISKIMPGMQLLIWVDGVKKPYNQTVTEENVKEVKEILSKNKITKIYVI